MKSGDTELRTPDKAVMFMNENKFVSANATVKKGNDTLKGDTITAFFKDTKRFEIDRAFSNGHTEIRSSRYRYLQQYKKNIYPAKQC